MEAAQTALGRMQDIHRAFPAAGVWVHRINWTDRFDRDAWLIEPPFDAPYNVMPSD